MLSLFRLVFNLEVALEEDVALGTDSRKPNPQLPVCAWVSWALGEANVKPHPPPAGTTVVAFGTS